MQNRRKLFRCMNQLQSFEAAARHSSFTLAAQDLGVTQPAISAAVRQLEAQLGISLFHRTHRRIRLTPEGKDLYLEARAAFDDLERCVQQLDQHGQGHHVTLSCSTAFANHWFVPRLGAFQQAHTHIDLRVQTTDRDLDLRDDKADLCVRRGQGLWPGYGVARLAEDLLFPVAAPGYARQQEAWMHQRLIHLEEPYRPRPGWGDFFRAVGLPVPTALGLRLNDYALVIQTAMAGQGIALGWSHIVAAPMAQGLLVQVGDKKWRTGLSHDLIWPLSAPDRPHVHEVREWMLRQV